ncbi:hypothetical protein SAMN05216559_0520 [Halomicrobium zhouii]|uniref:Uncharacterized protein n=1 Tax=Halomicrobium zhouii TaxID=767519 RepID=A0A1I6KBZ6_9EURY|nr:hypothetical protein SAMN05216559_0520 [Halomicrobium zhouii]
MRDLLDYPAKILAFSREYFRHRSQKRHILENREIRPLDNDKLIFAISKCMLRTSYFGWNLTAQLLSAVKTRKTRSRSEISSELVGWRGNALFVVTAVEVVLLAELPDTVADVSGEFELQVAGGLLHTFL